MIFLDADILLLAIRYPRDARFGTNERLLKTLQERGLARGITLYALLEVVGILSFNLPTDQIGQLSALLPRRYGLQVVPAQEADQDIPTFARSAILAQIEKKMALGDALQALYIQRFAPQATSLLSWNARHFHQKLSVPTFTPEEWLVQNAPDNVS
ncbi:MAG: hypothetical protein ACRERD_25105 [Candidatus Binatia bacterium]